MNSSKTTYTVFNLSPKPQKAKLNIGGQTLKEEPNPIYLGVKFDPRLTWNAQAEQSRNKGIRRTALLRKLTGTDWGADHQLLRKAYVGYVRSALEYGLSAWGTTADSNLQKICRVQNQNLRIMTGAIRSTPIRDMESLSGLEPMEDRRDLKQITQLEKIKRIPHHPMKERSNKSTKSRLKRTSFLHDSRRNSQDLDLPTQDNPEPMTLTSTTLWNAQEMPQIIDSIANVRKKADVPQDILSGMCKEYINEKYPTGTWTRVYTDGSATDAIRDGGGGIYIEWPDGTTESHAIPTGQHSTNYRAEMAALEEAATILITKVHTEHPIVLLSDAKSVLQALETAEHHPMKRLQSILCQLHQKTKTVIQWIPGHTNIPGNDEADKLAKEGAKMLQVEHDFDLSEMKTLTKAAIRKRWNNQHPGFIQKDAYYSLTRPQQVTIFRLRTGHNRLRQHMFSKFKVGETPGCRFCKDSPETTSHILQECSHLSTHREEVWDSPTMLRTKLYGTAEDLRRTVIFIEKTGLKV